MKKFTKGSLITYVDEKDKRIADYKANGWEEVEAEAKSMDEADTALEKAFKDVVENTSAKEKRKTTSKTDKKVNETIASNSTAAKENAEVDDGLFTKTEEV